MEIDQLKEENEKLTDEVLRLKEKLAHKEPEELLVIRTEFQDLGIYTHIIPIFPKPDHHAVDNEDMAELAYIYAVEAFFENAIPDGHDFKKDRDKYLEAFKSSITEAYRFPSAVGPVCLDKKGGII